MVITITDYFLDPSLRLLPFGSPFSALEVHVYTDITESTVAARNAYSSAENDPNPNCHSNPNIVIEIHLYHHDGQVQISHRPPTLIWTLILY